MEPLESRVLLASLPAGFTETAVATGLASGTAMDFAPNGDLWVLEQGGAVKRFRAGSTTADVVGNASTLGLSSAGERGLLGIAFDPLYATNKEVYLYYTATTLNTHNRISRFTVVDTDATDYYFAGTSTVPADAGSSGTPTETVIFNLDPLSTATNHNGGAIHFGPDGKLYAGVGENANGANAQTLSNVLGKMLRINGDGTIPSDNPFFNTAIGQNRAIWALGLRNPFTFAFQPGTGGMFINDVGQNSWEEINEGIAGSNYGWPSMEGNQGTLPSGPGTYRGPLYTYSHGGGTFQGFAIAGGAFYNPTIQQFPASYAGDYFFGDYVNDWINVLDVGTGTVTSFATNAPGIVDLHVTSDGGLYYLARDANKVFRVTANSPWTGYAHDAQHTAVSPYISQPLQGVAWQTPVDLAPQYSGDDLLIHYGSPLVTAANTVIVPVKTGAAGGFQVEGINGSTGAIKWTQTTDYVLPPYNWVPSYSPTLTPANRLYFAGAGGTTYYLNSPDANGATTSGQLAFFGLANYNANKAAYDGSVFINTPITSDSAGNIYFGFQVTGSNPLNLQSGIARIDASGNGTWVSAATLSGGPSTTKVVMNAAPALSNDGLTLYVPVNQGNMSSGYLLALSSTTLSLTGKVRLKDPNGNDASLPDDGTASPTVGPSGDVFFGVLETPFPYNHDRGWLLHFSANLTQTYAPGAFGWDDTASIVPATMVPSYQGTSSYLLMTKYNNYAGVGGDGVNKLAILDPQATMIDPITGNTVMKEVLTIAGVTPDPEFGGNAVREWCINTAVVDPQTDSVLANNEDGKLYRWNLGTNTFTEVVTLTSGIGEAYTPTIIGVDGTVYAINNAILFAVRPAPEITIKQGTTSLTDGQTVNFGSTTQGTPVTQTFSITNDGTAPLTLISLTTAVFPAGFSLAADYGSLSLAAAQSTTFSLRLNATAAGSFSGPLQLANNDSDENPFDLTLAGTVTNSPSSLVLAIDVGGGAAGSYGADQYFSGGNTYSTLSAINTSGVSNPAPQSVYQSERYGNFSYGLPGLTAGTQYTVRLHFAEIYWTVAGQRLFNVQINGAAALTNYDVFADAGGIDKAVVKSFTATADSAGKITLTFTTVRDNAKLSGIEILSAGPSTPNTPPIVATAASASPSPVTGTTANLSVLGNDADTGEASLTYTWSLVSGPAGAPTPTFSANGTNAAKNSTATFFKAGSYTLRATLIDPAAASVSSDVTVTVNQTATSAVVTPATASVVNGGTQSFTATMLDQFGTALSSQPSFTWTIDSGGVGSINASGLYTAPPSGTGSATVRATSGGISATASVTVTAPSSLVLALDAGGGAAGSYGADQYFSGGNTYSTLSAINTSGVSNPAPQSVYQTERYGNFSYVLPGLTAGTQYTVRLHFAEIYWTVAGQRLFNVQINGAAALTNYDVFADAGGIDKAVVKSFTATADSAGKITLTFTTVRDNAKLSGVEILAI